MILIVISILVIGAFIVSAINKNTEATLNNKPDEVDYGDDTTYSNSNSYNEVQKEKQDLNQNTLLDELYKISVLGVSDPKVLSNQALATYAKDAGIPYSTYADLDGLRKSFEFLHRSGCLTRIGKLHEDGWTDKQISKNVIVGRPRLRKILYTEDDIENIREQFID